MPGNSKGVTLASVDLGSTFPFMAIFRSFKLATQPGKMMLALMLVVVMFVVGWALDDLLGGYRVLPGEFKAYVEQYDAESFDQWREEARQRGLEQLAFMMHREVGLSADEAQALIDRPDRWAAAEAAIKQHRREQITVDPNREQFYRTAAATARADLDQWRPTGVFRHAIQIKIRAFRNLVDSAINLRFGFNQLDPSEKLDGNTVIGALRTVLWALPAWLWQGHQIFMIIWLAVFLGTWSLLGGAISRVAVVEAATGRRPSMSEGVSFVAKRWVSFILMPLVPLIFFGLLALGLALAGLLFHLTVVDIVAAVFWAIAIPIGLLIAAGLVGWSGAVHLMYPALSAESSDLFDGVSRSYSYVVTRPWRFIGYTLIALGYGAVTYLFVGLLIFLTLFIARQATGLWSGPFMDLMPLPQWGELEYHAKDAANWSARIAGAVVKVWAMLTVGMVAAYAVSFYFSAYSVIYLLMRHSCDGTDPSVIAVEAPAPEAAPAPAVVSVDPDINLADDQ